MAGPFALNVDCNCCGGPTTLCGSCQLPQTMHVTDSHTTVAVVWNSTLKKWIGCYLMTESTVITPCDCFNGVAPSGGGSIMIKYEIIPSASGACVLSIDRFWPPCNSINGPYYCEGAWDLSTCSDPFVDCSGQPMNCGFAGSDSNASTGCTVPSCTLPITCTLTLGTPFIGITSPLGSSIVIDV